VIQTQHIVLNKMLTK